MYEGYFVIFRRCHVWQYDFVFYALLDQWKPGWKKGEKYRAKREKAGGIDGFLEGRTAGFVRIAPGMRKTEKAAFSDAFSVFLCYNAGKNR